MRVILFMLTVVFFSTAVAQTNRIDSLQLFYKINEVESEYNSFRIDSMLKTLTGLLAKVKITGYADFLYNDDYNISLSQKRADAVKEYLQSKASSGQITVISCRGLGEKFSKEYSSREGDPYQRRVTVVIELPLLVKENNNFPVKEEAAKEEEKEPANDIEDLAEGESLAIEGLNFEPGRHYITKNSVPVLQKLLKTLETNKKLKIEIQGHVCCTYGQDDGLDYDTHERKLSQNRAKAIYDYLVSKGINSKRLSYKGFGHSKPKFPTEATPEEEQANRRVEILILAK